MCVHVHVHVYSIQYISIYMHVSYIGVVNIDHFIISKCKYTSYMYMYMYMYDCINMCGGSSE